MSTGNQGNPSRFRFQPYWKIHPLLMTLEGIKKPLVCVTIYFFELKYFQNTKSGSLYRLWDADSRKTPATFRLEYTYVKKRGSRFTRKGNKKPLIKWHLIEPLISRKIFFYRAVSSIESIRIPGYSELPLLRVRGTVLLFPFPRSLFLRATQNRHRRWIDDRWSLWQMRGLWWAFNWFHVTLLIKMMT